jgi:hypothetical protein
MVGPPDEVSSDVLAVPVASSNGSLTHRRALREASTSGSSSCLFVISLEHGSATTKVARDIRSMTDLDGSLVGDSGAARNARKDREQP